MSVWRNSNCKIRKVVICLHLKEQFFLTTRRNKYNLKTVPKVFVYNGNTQLQKGIINIMKNLKNYLVLTLFTLITCLIFFACSQENEVVKKNEVENVNIKTTLSNRIGTITCYISGSTVTNANTNIASSTVNAGATTTYQYNSNPAVTNIQWVVVSGTGISFVGSTTNSSVTVSFSSTFTGGSIQAIGTDATGQICGPVLPIIKYRDCACPNPVIRCTLAVSGGHPYWRFQLDNLQSGDTFLWSHNHAPIFGSLTNNSYVIANPDGPLYSGFTMYCEVSRRCTNGTIKKRKAFYTNYYGGTTTSGTQGFINLGGICDSNLGAQ